jgi:hypothetical protein
MGLGEEPQLLWKVDLQSLCHISLDLRSLCLSRYPEIEHFEEASAMNTIWHTETGRLACRWSELP